jgi:protein-tyrosine phosphatase
MTRLTGAPEGAKILVFCESGKGRTACMGAAYWISQGLTTGAAITVISDAIADKEWVTPKRRRILEEYGRLQRD